MGDAEMGDGPPVHRGPSPLQRLWLAVVPGAAAPAAGAPAWRPPQGGEAGWGNGVGGGGPRRSHSSDAGPKDADGEGGDGSADESHAVDMDPGHTHARPTVVGVAKAALGEFFGVLLFVLFANAAAAAQATGSPGASLVDVTLISGLGLAMAILVAGPRSGDHLNPALSFAVAVFRRGSLPLWELPIFVAAQVAGAVAGAALVYALYRHPLAAFEAAAGLDRSSAAAVATGCLFFCTYPSTGADLSGSLSMIVADVRTWPAGLVDTGTAFLAEALGAAVLATVVSGVLDKRAVSHMGQEMTVRAVAIGLCVFILEMILGPISSGCFNPARDLGPRILAAAAGWGSAFPGDRGHMWVYIVAPLVGSSVGVLLYDWVLSAGLGEDSKED